ncbi:hypothetical protein QQ73_14750, partial [Candidatus Endoriftia persephone str. Guaymas]|nr:hypothetical protein [Candidatus Endoriftia persephone str. Guaymas]
MNLAKILIKTSVVRSGMSFGDALQECVDKDVPGIPYVDAEGRIAGRFSVRHAFRECCVPRDLILGGHLLGDDIDHMNLPEVHAEEV